MIMPPLILASASPARRRLLENIGLVVKTQPSHFDESQIQDPDPRQLVARLAQAKAEVVAHQTRPPALILGCDSVLEMGGVVYGKPTSPGAARQQWQRMRGQVGYLHTGHALVDLNCHQWLVETETTEVHFASPTDAQIDAYIATGEPLACAGAFALEGRGSLWIRQIVGTPSNVIGLSVPLLAQMLQGLGWDIAQAWPAD